MKRAMTFVLAAALGVATLGLTGCYRVELPEDQKFHVIDSDSSASAEGNSAFPLEGAKSLDATVRMGVGRLTLKGGNGADAVDVTYDSDPDSLQPVAEYEVDSSGVGRISIEQRGAGSHWLGNGRNEWTVRLNEDMPLDLTVELGAGEADIELGGLVLGEFRMNMGAGDATLDFSGAWDHDVTASVEAGVGQLTLRLPEDVGVRVTGRHGGIGDFVADSGFTADGDAFVNDAYGTASTTIEISIKRGIGEVKLETVR